LRKTVKISSVVFPVEDGKKKMEGKERHKKSRKRYISPIRGEAPRKWILTKFCTLGDMLDIIICANFGVEKLRGLGNTRGQILEFPIEMAGHLYNRAGATAQPVMVDCHYFPPRPAPAVTRYLSSQTASPHFDRHQITLLGDKGTCLICEQLANSSYLAVHQVIVKSATLRSPVRYTTTTPPSFTVVVQGWP